MATKSAAKPKTKKTASRTTQKAAPRKTAAKKTPAAKSVKKAPAKKAAATKTATRKTTAAKKATVKKPAAKKAATKAATAKKAPARKKATAKVAPKPAAMKKPAAKKTATKPAAAKKAPARKKATAKAAPKPAAAKKESPASKAKTVKAAAKTAAKAVKKPSAKTAAATGEAAAEAPKKRANVGQAPRKTTFAASIPVPTQVPLREAPEADEKSSRNVEASSSAKLDFKVNDQIVYPAHGVGQIVGLEKQEVAGVAIELFVIDFDQEKMKLRVPTGKAKAAGMRALSSDKAIKDAITTLKGRARIKRTMWSRRAQEYDAKINSGDIKLVAEVVRDLYRAEDQPEQSYSERQLFEAALDRMAREVAAVRKADRGAAIEELEASLRKKAAA